jgi:hypothetical protein
MSVMENHEIRAELASLHAKVDRVLELLERMRPTVPPARTSQPRPKSSPLSPEEIPGLKERFQGIFERWLAGHEVEVQAELEAMEVDELRRLGDANNLNVTSKMPRLKLLQLMSARFREKKQLQVHLDLGHKPSKEEAPTD